MADAGRIRIYRRRHTVRNGRREEEEAELYYETWCSVGSLYGQELYRALDIRLENTVVFEVRHCRRVEEIRRHLKEYFIEYRGERYNIYASDARRNDRQYIQLKADRVE